MLGRTPAAPGLPSQVRPAPGGAGVRGQPGAGPGQSRPGQAPAPVQGVRVPAGARQEHRQGQERGDYQRGAALDIAGHVSG